MLMSTIHNGRDWGNGRSRGIGRGFGNIIGSRLSLILSVLLFLFSGSNPVLGQECMADGRCDTHERCPVWKEEGECFRNEQYMKKHCPVSCAGVQRRNLTKECKDIHKRCPVWAELGECSESADMRRYCAKSCDSCADAHEGDDLCVDSNEQCSFWADQGECTNNSRYMHVNCAKSCGTCIKTQTRRTTSTTTSAQNVDDKDEVLSASAKYGEKQVAEGTEMLRTLERIRATLTYMQSAQVTNLPRQVKENCKNSHEFCSFWAVIGECEKNQAFMKINCAPACHSCHLIDIKERCPLLEDAIPALKPGDLNKMFERIVATAPGNNTLSEEERQKLRDNGMTEYTVVVHSRPSKSPATEVSASNDKSLPPWVITFDNFLTPEECDTLIQLGYKEGYKRSEDVGKQKFDGTVDSVQSQGRTSENAWCSGRTGCRHEDVPERVHNRMSQIMGIPPENSEDMQLLRYEVGQFYNTHHDYIPHQRDRQCGPRILTFFMYLSDVEAGGGTNFPDLGITIMPKKGRALLWPSVYDSSPMNDDRRMRHQALPVEAGTKFASNGWIHMYDYVSAQERGCN